jgi:hypothetical protein
MVFWTNLQCRYGWLDGRSKIFSQANEKAENTITRRATAGIPNNTSDGNATRECLSEEEEKCIFQFL